jgi:hypothetical protein
MAAMKASQERTMEASVEKIELNQGKINQDGSCVEEKNVESVRRLEGQSKVSILTSERAEMALGTCSHKERAMWHV